MRFILLIIISSLINKLSEAQTSNQIPNITVWDSAALEKQRLLITKYVEQNPRKTTAFVKFSKNSTAQKIESLETFWENYELNFKDDGNYAEAIYKVITDNVGKVVAIFEIPVRGGDSEISFEHYFDQNGKTFCFRIEADAYTADDHLVETVSEYYTKEFKRITNEYKLVNEKGQTLDSSKYASIIDFINIPYKPESNSQLLIKRLGINNENLITNASDVNNLPIYYLGDDLNPDTKKFKLIGISSETNVYSYKYLGLLTGKYYYGRQIGDIVVGLKNGKIVTTIYNLIPNKDDVGVPSEIIRLIQKVLPFPLAYRDGIWGVNIDNESISISRTNNAMTFNKDRIMFLTTIKQSILRQ